MPVRNQMPSRTDDGSQADELKLGHPVLADQDKMQHQKYHHDPGADQPGIKHAGKPACLEQQEIKNVTGSFGGDHTLKMFSRLLPGLANTSCATPMARSLKPASQ